VTATRDLAVGEECTISYGALGNSELLRLYGFASELNPFDAAALKLPPMPTPPPAVPLTQPSAEASTSAGFASSAWPQRGGAQPAATAAADKVAKAAAKASRLARLGVDVAAAAAALKPSDLRLPPPPPLQPLEQAPGNHAPPPSVTPNGSVVGSLEGAASEEGFPSEALLRFASAAARLNSATAAQDDDDDDDDNDIGKNDAGAGCGGRGSSGSDTEARAVGGGEEGRNKSRRRGWMWLLSAVDVQLSAFSTSQGHDERLLGLASGAELGPKAGGGSGDEGAAGQQRDDAAALEPWARYCVLVRRGEKAALGRAAASLRKAKVGGIRGRKGASSVK